ncbi:MAG: glycosyltransferase family 2 protein [Solirubrobacterales bacterium]
MSANKGAERATGPGSQRERGGSVSLAVVVPSYRRPRELERCLDALMAQTRAPAQVIVALRAEDGASRETVAAREREALIEVVLVDRLGQLAALSAACARVRADAVAFTDDDCVAHPDWLERIAASFAEDAAIGAVGGRDVVHCGGSIDEREVMEVGRVRWFTRLVGNHHNIAPSQDVAFLKGACMAVRTACLPALEERLRGEGAQVHNDMQLTLAVHRAGWRVVYDPRIRVEHFPAGRFDGDGRARRSLRAVHDEHHNETLVLLSLLPVWQKPFAVAYRLLVGTRAAPGAALALPCLLRSPHRGRLLRESLAANAGRLAGLGTFLRGESRRSPQRSALASPGRLDTGARP